MSTHRYIPLLHRGGLASPLFGRARCRAPIAPIRRQRSKLAGQGLGGVVMALNVPAVAAALVTFGVLLLATGWLCSLAAAAVCFTGVRMTPDAVRWARTELLALTRKVDNQQLAVDELSRQVTAPDAAARPRGRHRGAEPA